MNLGQTFITLGMLSLLLLSVVSANRMIMDINQATLEAEAMTASSTIANDLLDEILAKRFDEWSDSTGTQPKSAFSNPLGGSPAEWGPGGRSEKGSAASGAAARAAEVDRQSRAMTRALIAQSIAGALSLVHRI